MSNYAKAFHIPLFKILQILVYQINKTTSPKLRAKALNVVFSPSFNVVHIHVHTYMCPISILLLIISLLSIFIEYWNKEKLPGFMHCCLGICLCISSSVQCLHWFRNIFSSIFSFGIKSKLNCYCQIKILAYIASSSVVSTPEPSTLINLSPSTYPLICWMFPSN